MRGMKSLNFSGIKKAGATRQKKHNKGANIICCTCHASDNSGKHEINSR